jgi:glycine cleavage system aminomethyltransferase T
MEKAYRDYAHDVDNTDSVLEAGLGFTCDFNKPDGFVGKEAVLKEKELPAARRLVQVRAPRRPPHARTLNVVNRSPA